MVAGRRNWGTAGVSLAIGGLGLAAAILGSGYRVGELTRMGPGFFPVLVGAAVVVLALACAIEAAREERISAPLPIRPVIFISLGMLAWIMLVEPFGLVTASFAMVGLSALANPPLRLRSTLALACGLCVSGYLVFIWGLGMPLTLWGR